MYFLVPEEVVVVPEEVAQFVSFGQVHLEHSQVPV
jgi:hypothetical protein